MLFGTILGGLAILLVVYCVFSLLTNGLSQDSFDSDQKYLWEQFSLNDEDLNRPKTEKAD